MERGDWVSVTKKEIPLLRDQPGFDDLVRPIHQFCAFSASEDISSPVQINRWRHPRDATFVLVNEAEIPDARMHDWGYEGKAPAFYGSRDQTILFENVPYRGIPVYRWRRNEDRNWVTLREGEWDDVLLQRWGYKKKSFQCYALPPDVMHYFVPVP